MGTEKKWMQTRAGLLPSDKEVPYTITTDDVQEYLAKKLAVVSAAAKRDGNRQIPEINFQVVTADMGAKNYRPLILMLPQEALGDRAKSDYSEPTILDIGSDSDSGRKVWINPDYFKVLMKPYMYNKDDRSAFSTAKFRSDIQISHAESKRLAQMSIPSVYKLNGQKYVGVLIDPMKIFHDMLEVSGDNRPFTVAVKKFKKLRSGGYRFNIIRRVNGGGKKGFRSGSIAEELSRKMRSVR